MAEEFNSYEPYLAYCRNTNEKEKLHKFICEHHYMNPQAILDIGSGNGINTTFLAKTFTDAHIDAIERSQSQLEYARKHNSLPNICYISGPFESFEASRTYDFILMSHTLQYITSDPYKFIEKAMSFLAQNGELWIVQQTQEGMAQIIGHQKHFLPNPKFRNWKTSNYYRGITNEILGQKENYGLSKHLIDSSLTKIDFVNPSEEDKRRLEFILCLEDSFDDQPDYFKRHLSRLDLGSGRIHHPNEILIVKRLK